MRYRCTSRPTVYNRIKNSICIVIKTTGPAETIRNQKNRIDSELKQDWMSRSPNRLGEEHHCFFNFNQFIFFRNYFVFEFGQYTYRFVAPGDTFLICSMTKRFHNTYASWTWRWIDAINSPELCNTSPWRFQRVMTC